MTTNFEPHEYVTFAQTTKIGTHEYKAIHSTQVSWALKSLLFLVVLPAQWNLAAHRDHFVRRLSDVYVFVSVR